VPVKRVEPPRTTCASYPLWLLNARADTREGNDAVCMALVGLSVADRCYDSNQASS
jgi:hypothetical protein